MPATPTKTRWGLVFLLILTGVIAAFQVGKGAIAVPTLRDDLELTLYFASWIVGALGGLGAFIGVPAGLVLSRFAPRRTLIAGLITIGVASIAGALAPSGPLLLITRVIE